MNLLSDTIKRTFYKSQSLLAFSLGRLGCGSAPEATELSRHLCLAVQLINGGEAHEKVDDAEVVVHGHDHGTPMEACRGDIFCHWP